MTYDGAALSAIPLVLSSPQLTTQPVGALCLSQFGSSASVRADGRRLLRTLRARLRSSPPSEVSAMAARSWKADLSNIYPFAATPISVAFMLPPFEVLRGAPLPIVGVNLKLKFRLEI